MKYLIVGADGQLGQEWVKVLSDQNLHYSAYHFTDLDITDFEKLEHVIKKENPSILINCAAYTAVDKAEDETELSDLINHLAVTKLADLCMIHEIKLVHYSTDYVFAGSEEDRKKYPLGYPEDAKPNPINEYGISKWKGEQAIQASGCDYLILRLSWLCGAHGNNFAKTMLRLAKEKESLNVVNDQFGVPTFTYQTVNDSLSLLNTSCSGIYHLGSYGIITWFEFAQKIFELTDLNVKVQPVDSSEFPTKAKRPSFSKLSTNKIEQDLKTESVSWIKGLENLLNQLNNGNHK